MYHLTLTHEERKAFDWVGGRYATGNDVAHLLFVHCTCYPGAPSIDWTDKEDITFQVPEHIAWEIKRLSELENESWPCFSGELWEKMTKFCNSIV